MTMPSLIANSKEKETVSRLKKAYSSLSQALIFVVENNGTPDNWGIGAYGEPSGAKNVINKFAPYLNIAEDCANGNDCINMQEYKNLNGNYYINKDMYSGVKLADGTYIMALAGSNDCSTAAGTSEELKHLCAFLYVDTNGARKPNVLGKDMFEFILTKNLIIPSGTQFADREKFNTHCLNKNSGLACTAWVLLNENMDYLHCNDLDWKGKTSCK